MVRLARLIGHCPHSCCTDESQVTMWFNNCEQTNIFISETPSLKTSNMISQLFDIYNKNQVCLLLRHWSWSWLRSYSQVKWLTQAGTNNSIINPQAFGSITVNMKHFHSTNNVIKNTYWHQHNKMSTWLFELSQSLHLVMSENYAEDMR